MEGKAQRRKGTMGWSPEAQESEPLTAGLTPSTPGDTEASPISLPKSSASPTLGWSVPKTVRILYKTP